MAELSEADKRILLGANYREVEKQEALKSDKTRSAEAASEKLSKLRQYRNTAGVIALLGGLVFATNYLQLSGPFQPNMSIAAAVGMIAGAAIAIFAAVKIQQA